MEIIRRLSPLLWILPLVASVLVLLSPQSDFLWVAGTTGGLVVTVRAAASIIVALYSAFLFYGLGRLITGAIDNRPVEAQLFFAVYLYGLLPVYYFGLLLGLLRLNHPLVNASIFVTAQFILWPYIRPAFRQLANWITASQCRSNAKPEFWLVIAIRAIAAFVFAGIFLFRVVPLDAANSDVIQLYYSYFDDVRRMGGIGYDPLQPRFVYALYGRGMGLHHFLTSFTDEYFIRFISFLFLIPVLSICISAQRTFIDNILKASPKWRAAASEFLGLALVVMIGCVVPMGKYHLLNATLYLAMISLAIDLVLRDGESEPTEKILFFILAATLPLVLVYNLVLLSLLFAAMMIVGVVRRGAVWRLALLGCAIIATSGLLSMLYNYFVLGLPELYPLALLTSFANSDVLSKWTHPAVFYYMLSIQNIHTFETRELLGKLFGAIACMIVYCGLSVHFRTRSHKIQSTVDAPITARQTAWFQGLLDVTFALAFFSFIADLLLEVSHHDSLRHMLYYSAVLRFMFAASVVGLSVHFKARLHKVQSSVDAQAPITARSPVSLQGLLDVTFVLAIIYFIVDLLIGVSNHDSLRRMLYYSAVLRYLFAASALGLVFASATQWFSLRKSLPFLGAISCLVLLAGATAEARKAFRDDQLLTQSAIYHTTRWLIGDEGFLAAQTAWPWSFSRCRSVDKALPPGARILPLNANVALTPCYFSPLTEHGKFIHHYESVLAPHFLVLLFGGADEQEATYKRLGVNYFLFVFKDSQFFGPGFGDLFSADELPQRFRIYARTDDYAILTWRGDDDRPLDPRLVRSIEDARRLEQVTLQSFSFSWGLTKTWEAFRATCGPTCHLPSTLEMRW